MKITHGSGWRKLWFPALAALAGACAGKSVDIGDDKPATALGQSLSDYAGQWVGYAEAYEWDDQTDRVSITLDANGDGVLEVGDAPPLPPPEYLEPYPPSPNDMFSPPGVPVTGLVSGFPYTVSGARVESTRIKLGVASGELYEGWCGFFEPVANTYGSGMTEYACAPGVSEGWSSMDGVTCYIAGDTSRPESCALLDCIHTCRCTETECTSLNAGISDIELDAVLENEGDQLEGTLVIPGSRIVVRMTRM